MKRNSATAFGCIDDPLYMKTIKKAIKYKNQPIITKYVLPSLDIPFIVSRTDSVEHEDRPGISDTEFVISEMEYDILLYHWVFLE